MNTLPQQFQDRVRDRMKEIIGELIPDDAWQAMVEKTIADFIRDDLPKMVKTELSNQMVDRIKVELGTNEWQSRWNNNGPLAGAMVEEVVKQTAPELVSAMFGGIVQHAVLNLRNNLPRY